MDRVIGIDPGANGALAWMDVKTGKMVTHLYKDTPPKDAILDAICGVCTDDVIAYIEEVGGYIGRPQPGSAMFKFGENFGFWQGVLTTLGIKTIRVRPQTWQKGILRLQGKKGPERKRILRNEAIFRFPGQKVTLDNCDAMLICEYGVNQL